MWHIILEYGNVRKGEIYLSQRIMILFLETSLLVDGTQAELRRLLDTLLCFSANDK
jgi:hypothetical protein